MEKLYNFLPAFIKEFYNNHFLAYPLIIKVAYVGIFLTFFVTMFCYLLVFTRRVVQASVNKKAEKWKAEIENILTNSIIAFTSEDYTDEHIIEITENLKKLPLKKRLVRQLIINELIFLHRNFSGKVNTLISRIYTSLELQKHSQKKLRSWRWFNKAEGIAELGEMGIQESAGDFLQYVNSRNITLRMQAQSGYLQASQTDPFVFLDYTNQNLLTFHQINLMDILNRNKDIKLPVFSKWFTSANDSVVIFCIRLTVRFHQIDSVKDLLRLFNHPNEEVRKEVITAVGDLSLVDLEQHLTIHFRNETQECRLEIIKTTGKICSGDSLNFLSDLVFNTDFSTRFEAAKALKRHGEMGEERLFRLLETVPEENKSVVLHMLDTKLSA
ncbi:HEAT repeat domain-containing protein [Flavihumibacter sp. R14]|nr:HEAT repeat domain-containing protein [Flavihumibacter soli]